MKKNNVLFAIMAVLILLGGFFACQMDTAERIHVTFTDPSGGNPDRTVDIVKGDALGFLMYTPSREGPFSFYGWFEGQSQYYSDTPISVDITLTARWADEIATVSFAFTQTNDAGDVIQPTATIPPVTAIKSLPLGPLAFPATPRAKGWKFDSWLLDGEEFTKETVVPSDITLTAKWVPAVSYTVSFDSKGGAAVASIQVFAGECIDEWELPGQTRFPPKLEENTVNTSAFFVAWFDDEMREYDGRTPVTRNVTLGAKWGLPAFKVNLRLASNGGHIRAVQNHDGSSEGTTSFQAVSKLAWDSDPESDPENEKWVIVNERMYDFPDNTNRWKILYRIQFAWPSSFSTDFYTKYTIRARFYANKQGAASWTDETAFTPNVPAAETGYKEAGWLRKKDYGVLNDDGTMKEYSRSEDGWGQISWTSVANWNGAGADADTMIQRYNLDRKGGTINDQWAPLNSKDLKQPPYLLIQTSDAYIGHIEITDIIFHNGEFEYANYLDEKPPEASEE